MVVDFQKIQDDIRDCRELLLTIKASLDLQPVTNTTDDGTPLGVQQAADFLGIAPQTIYQRIKKLPHKKRFGRLYFYRRDLIEYLNSGEGSASADDEADALPFGPVNKNKRGVV